MLLGAAGRQGVRSLKKTRPDLVKHIETIRDTLEMTPERMFFCDTEFIRAYPGGIYDPHACQVSVLNGNSEDIVPVATMCYHKSKLELWNEAELNLNRVWSKSTFLKFYGMPDNSPVTAINGAYSLDFDTMGAVMEAYYEGHGIESKDCLYLEWSNSGYLDYTILESDLRKIGKHHLLPPMPQTVVDRPNIMSCYRALRNCIEGHYANTNVRVPHMRLNLGNIYSIIRPDDRETLKTAHTADTDVKMLIAATTFFVNLFDEKPSRGRIEQYFTQKGAKSVEEPKSAVQTTEDGLGDESDDGVGEGMENAAMIEEESDEEL